MPPTEQETRQTIDQLLQAAGWNIQGPTKYPNLHAAPGVAVREVSLQTGIADYLLFVEGQALGVIEAKREGTPLTVAEPQSARYSVGLKQPLRAWRADGLLPFLYESTGVETFFTDLRDPAPRSRRVFAFHQPATLAEWVQQEKSLRGRFHDLPDLLTDKLWPPQVEAVTKLEQSLQENRPRALIQMATGSGKTFTAVNFAYRLVRYAGAKRILFLVDRANLGRQAYAEFQNFSTPDDGRKFTELFNVRHLTENHILPHTEDVNRVYISTIQRIYAILRDEELEEETEERSLYELDETGGLPRSDQPRTVSYTPQLPLEFFDLIIIDECHRSIYNLWRQVLDYFDAHLIGLTATPAQQTIAFFNENLITEYDHLKAVADGINVAGEVYRIRTKLGEQGGEIGAGEFVTERNRLTRAQRQRLLDEAFVYTGNQLGRQVISPSQLRLIIRTFRERLFTELFPHRTGENVPKTLIFAKDDNHAEEIVRLVREEFGEGNEFCQKVTYNWPFDHFFLKNKIRLNSAHYEQTNHTKRTSR